ncbi:hypothetical protein HK097_011026 [Rhizophlyctis rosea]|uniref:B box-type domain-containing protein n=1 Tax=Rhizophlyctis rosea TaxID=64517 RepID=A0AAD5X258_9FUNG|nr:hypothetical protein HK097_011026 [Rhizophlyctis rosea]
MTDKAGGKTQLSPSTPEFAYLEYGLQLALRAGTARIVAAYALSNPHLTLQFEKRSKDILMLPSWIDATELTGANTEEDVIKRGFQFTSPQTGMKFCVGRFKMSGGSPARSKDGKPLRQIRKVLMCRIAVGRAYVCDEAEAEGTALPEGYDSFYLKVDSTVGRDSKAAVEDYHHEYYIKGSNQVLPMYMVHYDYDPVKERRSREKPKCENCEEEPATLFCSADAANLCNKCDGQLHMSKLASRHVRTGIGKGSDVFGHCRHHPDKQIEFFCSQCHIPVCVFCKMVGNHANGEAAKHQLVSVGEAYSTVLQEATTTDPILQQRRTEILSHITSLTSRSTAVEKMGQQLESDLSSIYQKALSDLRTIISIKQRTLEGDRLELLRHLGEINRLEEFLKYQKDGDATGFLFNWSRHVVYRSELRDFGGWKRGIDVELDARITGTVNVVIDTDRPTVQSSQSHGHHHHHTSPGKTMKSPTHNSGSPVGGLAGTIGIGLPKRLPTTQDRRVHRRTSDFFAETLGTFDEMSINQQHSTDDGYSEMSIPYHDDD